MEAKKTASQENISRIHTKLINSFSKSNSTSQSINFVDAFSELIMEITAKWTKRKVSFHLSSPLPFLGPDLHDFMVKSNILLGLFFREQTLLQSGKKSKISDFLLSDSGSIAYLQTISRSKIEWSDNTITFFGKVKKHEKQLLFEVIEAFFKVFHSIKAL